MKLSDRQLRIVAGYVCAYSRLYDKFHSTKEHRYEVAADRERGILAHMLLLLADKPIIIPDQEFLNIDPDAPSDIVLPQVAKALETI